jgi:hypothetical protein
MGKFKKSDSSMFEAISSKGSLKFGPGEGDLKPLI